MITKALRPDISVAEAAREAGVPKQTLYMWLRRAKLADVSSRSKKKSCGRPRSRKSSRWNPEEKLRILIEASALKDEELGAFMRREGLHEADLQEMREAALAGLWPAVVRRGPSAEEQELKKLRSELSRKEKALAEAAALLLLKKSTKALWRKRTTAWGETQETTLDAH